MCGIAGIISQHNQTEALRKMLISQHHRGPDFTGSWSDNTLAYLGHNRLAIIDLKAQSNQPFHCAENRYTITFNGEIYNYIELKKELENHYNFYTDSDTEVLLNAYKYWGKECLHHFRGMWSFAIWDKQENTLFASRDRFGVKPFYYVQTKDAFAFASEPKAFWAANLVKKEWNNIVLSRYLSQANYGMPDECMFANIHQLPGGHSLTWQANKIIIKKWYHFEKEVHKIKHTKSAFEIQNELKALLEENIKLRLRSDVPVGFNLSGGVDSTLLFQLIRKQLNYDKTSAFTFYSNDVKYDETDWVKQIIGDSGFKWQKCLVDKYSIAEFAEKIQHHADEPYSGIATLAYARTFEEARKNNYIVLLDGSGIDEQFAGYDYYTKTTDLNVQGTTTSPVRLNCLDNDFIALANKSIYAKPFVNEILNLQYRDTIYTKLQRDMRFNDRISMAFSTELREPFLDHKLFEYAFALPLEYKIHNGQRKYIIRQIIKESLNTPLVEAPKRPVQTPQREWLSNDLKDWVIEMTNIATNNYAFLNKKETKRELDLFFNQNNENSFYIWQWITLGMIKL